MNSQQKKTLWREMPAERLVKLYMERPCNPMLSTFVKQERQDVVALYSTLKQLAGWK